eukprot:480591-Alexandrium_andersonii.AAC.1
MRSRPLAKVRATNNHKDHDRLLRKLPSLQRRNPRCRRAGRTNTSPQPNPREFPHPTQSATKRHNVAQRGDFAENTSVPPAARTLACAFIAQALHTSALRPDQTRNEGVVCPRCVTGLPTQRACPCPSHADLSAPSMAGPRTAAAAHPLVARRPMAGLALPPCVPPPAAVAPFHHAGLPTQRTHPLRNLS